MKRQVGLGLLPYNAMLGVWGCEPANDNPPTFPVTSTVTIKGQPVEGADIVFVPSTPEALAAFAKTDDDGKFEMRTIDPGDGVVAGTYKVMVSKLEAGKVDDTKVFATAEEEATAYAGPEAVAPAKNLLPRKHADHNTSGLTHFVASQPTVFDIKL